MKSRCINKKRATIIPTVLFVAMFVVMMSTLMLAAVSYNLGMSLNAVDKIDFRYTSFAAVNELLSDINHGTVDWDEYKKGNPRTVVSGGVVTESWIQPLDPKNEAKPLSPEDKKHFFAVARTYRDGAGHGSGETVKKLATYRPNSKSRVYVNAPEISDSKGTYTIYYNNANGSNTSAWIKLPPIPRQWYDDSGNLQKDPNGYAESKPYISAAPDGSLYAIYTPALDGLKNPKTGEEFDKPMGANFKGLGTDLSAGLLWPIAKIVVAGIPIKWGNFALNTIVAGSKQGYTVGDLAPIPQVLVSAVPEVTVSKGAVMLKYTEGNDGGDGWSPLPAAPEATYDKSTKSFKIVEGDYHLKGVTSAPVAFSGGVATALFRDGQDSIYTYTEGNKESNSNNLNGWEVIPPPTGETDVLLLTADQNGTIYTQTGNLEDPGPMYLINILLGNLGKIDATTATSKLSKYERGKWTTIPDPPAKFYDDQGNLQELSYAGTRGPTLSAMTGGEKGELYVVNRPRTRNTLNGHLNDTTYRFSDGFWEPVAPPPSTIYNDQGDEVEGAGNNGSATSPPERTDLGMGAQGELIMRVPPKQKAAVYNIDWLNGQEWSKPIYNVAHLIEGLLNGDILNPNKETLVDGIYLQDYKDKKKFNLLPAVKKDETHLETSFSQMSVGHRKDESGLGDFTIHATYF